MDVDTSTIPVPNYYDVLTSLLSVERFSTSFESIMQKDAGLSLTFSSDDENISDENPFVKEMIKSACLLQHLPALRLNDDLDLQDDYVPTISTAQSESHFASNAEPTDKEANCSVTVIENLTNSEEIASITLNTDISKTNCMFEDNNLSTCDEDYVMDILDADPPQGVIDVIYENINRYSLPEVLPEVMDLFFEEPEKNCLIASNMKFLKRGDKRKISKPAIRKIPTGEKDLSSLFKENENDALSKSNAINEYKMTESLEISEISDEDLTESIKLGVCKHSETSECSRNHDTNQQLTHSSKDSIPSDSKVTDPSSVEHKDIIDNFSSDQKCNEITDIKNVSLETNISHVNDSLQVTLNKTSVDQSLELTGKTYDTNISEEKEVASELKDTPILPECSEAKDKYNRRYPKRNVRQKRYTEEQFLNDAALCEYYFHQS